MIRAFRYRNILCSTGIERLIPVLNNGKPFLSLDIQKSDGPVIKQNFLVNNENPAYLQQLGIIREEQNHKYVNLSSLLSAAIVSLYSVSKGFLSSCFGYVPENPNVERSIGLLDKDSQVYMFCVLYLG